jgi:predicted dehydrogenase
MRVDGSDSLANDHDWILTTYLIRAGQSLEPGSTQLAPDTAALTAVRGSTTGLPVTTVDPVSLDDPFHRQLQAFHHAIAIGDSPLVDGSDATADLELAEQIVATAARHDADGSRSI